MRNAMLSSAFLLICAMATSTVRGEDVFTLAVAPDTQQEILNDSDTRFKNRLQWILNNKTALNIKVFFQVGDLNNWDTPTHDQYVRSSAGLKLLDDAGFPYILSIGNHDTAATKEGGSAAPGDVHANLRNTTTFNHYFPLSRVKLLQGVFEAGKIDNGWHVFSAGGLDWLVINYELWPRTVVINWMKTIVAAHPHHNVIFLTHSHVDSGNPGALHPNNGGYGDNSPQFVFDQAMKPYANVRLIFCGHIPVWGYRTDKGAAGNTIYEFNQTYHDNATNPVRLLEINTKLGTIKTHVYCPSIGQDKNDGSAFTISGIQWVQPASTASAPAITAQPANKTVTVGQTATFTVAASGSPAPTYQWQKNNANIGGATAASYTTPATLIGDSGDTFRCVVSNSAGSATSAGATLTVNAAAVPPTVATPASGPGSVTGTTAAVSVLGGPAGSESGLTYTWSVVSAPSGGTATFSANGTNAAQHATITFNRVGTWQVHVTIHNPANGTSTVSGTVTIVVNATYTSVAVTGPTSVASGANAQFTAKARDQFAQALASQPTFTWSASGGTISASGLFTTSATSGSVQVAAASGGKTGTANIAITASGGGTGGGGGSGGGSGGSAASSNGHGCGVGGNFAMLAVGVGFLVGRLRRRPPSDPR